MKRIVLLSATLLGGSTGCVMPFLQPPQTKPAEAPAPPPPPAVTADGITDRNAPERAKALRAELEREAARPAPWEEEAQKK